MVTLDLTIVTVALPHIQAALGFSGSNLEWVVNAYAVAFGGLLLLGGRAGDLKAGASVISPTVSVLTLPRRRATGSRACRVLAVAALRCPAAPATARPHPSSTEGR
jgi:MFS family permease